MAIISTVLNPEAQEFIPQNSFLLLPSHPFPFPYTNFILTTSTPVVSFYNSPSPPSPYFATSTHCYYQYQYRSTPPPPLLNPETHCFSANCSDFLTPPPPPANPYKRSIRAQISVELEQGPGDWKPAAGHHSRGGGLGRGPCGGRRSPPSRRGGGGGGEGGRYLGSCKRGSAWKEELSSLRGAINNSSSEEEYYCSVHPTTSINKYRRIVEPREMMEKKKMPVLPVDEGSDCTTVMIRNIPNKYTYVPFFETSSPTYPKKD